MSDRVRKPISADGAPARASLETVDPIAWFKSRADMETFALQAAGGVTAGGAVMRPVPAANPNNLINDPDFENAVLDANWNAQNTQPSVSSAFFYSGTQAMAVLGANTAYYGWQNSIPGLQCNPGDGLYFSGYFRHQGANASLVQVGFTFFAADGITVLSTVSTPLDQLINTDGFVFKQVSAKAPLSTAFFRVFIFTSHASTNLYVDQVQLVLTNANLGPLSTSPSQSGPRVDADGNHIHTYTDHHLETAGGVIQTDVINGLAAAQDQPTLTVQPPLFGGSASAAFLELIGRSQDGTQLGELLLGGDAVQVNGPATFADAVTLDDALIVDNGITVVGGGILVEAGGLDVTGGITSESAIHAKGTSALDGLVTLLAGLDVTGTATLRGALNLLGGLNSSSFVLDIYTPVNINPVLSAIGTAASTAHTVATITDRKVAVLSVHIVSMATVNNTATNLQHIQNDVQISTDGGTTFGITGTDIPTTVQGSGHDRAVCVSVASFIGTATGALQIKPRYTWSTTVTSGAGGSANLQTFSSVTFTIVVAVN